MRRLWIATLCLLIMVAFAAWYFLDPRMRENDADKAQSLLQPSTVQSYFVGYTFDVVREGFSTSGFVHFAHAELSNTGFFVKEVYLNRKAYKAEEWKSLVDTENAADAIPEEWIEHSTIAVMNADYLASIGRGGNTYNALLQKEWQDRPGYLMSQVPTYFQAYPPIVCQSVDGESAALSQFTAEPSGQDWAKHWRVTPLASANGGTGYRIGLIDPASWLPQYQIQAVVMADPPHLVRSVETRWEKYEGSLNIAYAPADNGAAFPADVDFKERNPATGGVRSRLSVFFRNVRFRPELRDRVFTLADLGAKEGSWVYARTPVGTNHRQYFWIQGELQPEITLKEAPVKRRVTGTAN